jgi:hypothetical protein
LAATVTSLSTHTRRDCAIPLSKNGQEKRYEWENDQDIVCHLIHSVGRVLEGLLFVGIIDVGAFTTGEIKWNVYRNHVSTPSYAVNPLTAIFDLWYLSLRCDKGAHNKEQALTRRSWL